MEMLCLVGEQPIPNLLPVLALKPDRVLLAYTDTTERVAKNLEKIIQDAVLHHVDPYNLFQARLDLEAVCKPDTMINLTGGTKPMALAAYDLARTLRLPFIYLQSEGKASILYRYDFGEHDLIRKLPQKLGSLITLQIYLDAHNQTLLAEKGPQSPQEAGLRRWFEKHVDECRANLIFEAFEIDFLLRRGNQVAIVEAKNNRENSRHGIDQLNTAGGRAYLGTYTGKILITSRPLGDQLSHLAEARQIEVVQVHGRQNRQTGRLDLSSMSQSRLKATLDKVLGPPSML